MSLKGIEFPRYACVSIKENPTYAVSGKYQNGGGVLAWCMSIADARVVANWYRDNGGKRIHIETFKDHNVPFDQWTWVIE